MVTSLGNTDLPTMFAVAMLAREATTRPNPNSSYDSPSRSSSKSAGTSKPQTSASDLHYFVKRSLPPA